MGVNSDKPNRWKADVARSVDMYNDWFIRFAPEAFDTVGGTVGHVTIRLIDNSQDIIVDLDYTVFQLDIVPLTDFIRESVFGTDEEN